MHSHRVNHFVPMRIYVGFLLLRAFNELSFILISYLFKLCESLVIIFGYRFNLISME